MTLRGVKQESDKNQEEMIMGEMRNSTQWWWKEKVVGEYLSETVPYPNIMVQESENFSDLFLYWKMSFCQTWNVSSKRVHSITIGRQVRNGSTEAHSTVLEDACQFWSSSPAEHICIRLHKCIEGVLRLYCQILAQLYIPLNLTISNDPAAQYSVSGRIFVLCEQVKVVRLCYFIRYLFLLSQRNKKVRVTGKNVSFH